MAEHKGPKPILAVGQKRQEHARTKSVIWDEVNLEQNDAEKVPRMKIDEPKTPFVHGLSENSPMQLGETGNERSLPAFDLAEISAAALSRREAESKDEVLFEDGDDDLGGTGGVGSGAEWEDDESGSEMDGPIRDDASLSIVGRGLGSPSSADLDPEAEAREQARFEAQRKHHYQMQEGRVDIKSLLKGRAALAQDDDDDEDMSGSAAAGAEEEDFEADTWTHTDPAETAAKALSPNKPKPSV